MGPEPVNATLIPREVLFGNPVKAAPKISPDGTRLAYLAPSPEGVLNVWVRTLFQEDDRQVTQDAYRGIRLHYWAQSGRFLLFLQDSGGDENFHLHAVDLETGAVRDLTPFEGVRVQNLIQDRHHPDELLAGLNLRDRTVFDMHRIRIESGTVTLDTQNPGDVSGWLTDADFRIRGAMAMNPADATTILRVRASESAPWRDLLTWPFGEIGQALAFDKTGERLYIETTLGGDTARLAVIDAKSGEETAILAHHPRADVGATLINPETRAVEAVSFEYLRTEWTVLDPGVAADFQALPALQPGEFAVVSRDRSDRRWVILFERDDGPAAWYLWDRQQQKGDLLFLNKPDLAGFPLAPMEPVVVNARDGLELVSYLTLPPEGPRRDLPLVLLVHGGPWSRDRWGFDPLAQWFANRGYATLQVNYRGSIGFGKNFQNAGNGEWGIGSMQHDLTDAVAWAVELGIADPRRVCIYGGSYGGYAVLAGLCFTPGLYACGVDIVGPSNIRTLFESIPPYWVPFKRDFVQRVGDVEADEELNRRLSPLFHAGNIRVPLIIAQGQNDPRVVIREADQMVEALRAKGLPVTYVVYPDEGHGFARPQNRMDFFGRVEEFLSGILGGRFEPWSEVPGHTAELR